MTTAVCLVLTAVLVAAGIVLTVLSFRREDSFLGFAAMSALIIGAIPATVYATIDSALP